MDFDLEDEQEQLREAVRDLLDRHADQAAVRRAAETDSGFDAAVWRRLVEEIGVAGILVPEEAGGLGGGLVDAGVVLEEMGRSLFASPFLTSSVACASTLARAGDDELLAAIAEGASVVVPATAEAGDWSADADVRTTARRDGEGWRVSGTKRHVVDAVSADVLLVTAREGDGPVALYAVAVGGGVHIEPAESLDLTRRLATVELADAPARLIAADAAELLRDLEATAAVALAAEQLGAAQWCLASAVSYANVREQFGETIAHYQAVQHRCADILVEVEAARSAVYYALAAADEAMDGWREHARVAKIVASEALGYAAAENLHLHGGNGFTWEFPEHLYFRRARASEQLWGSPSVHRDALAVALGVTDGAAR